MAAMIASAAVVLSSPFIGELWAEIRSPFPEQFQAIGSVALAGAVVAALVAAVMRIRDRRFPRVSALAIGVVGAVLYARLVATDNADVHVVEYADFVEYFVIAWLFYRAFRPFDDGLALVWPLLGGVLVGTVDAFVQWFIPARVGEAHDILLNSVAVACGLCFAAALDPPTRLAVPLHRSATRAVRYGVSAVLIAFALFLQAVHIGYRLYDPEIGVFWSRYTASGLRAVAAERATRWRLEPPTVLHPLSREDQYLSEGLWHVRARNMAWSAGDPFTAWRENRILETFFAPVLDAPSYGSHVPPRWGPQQRADTAARVAGDPGFYISRAAPYPIYTWSPLAFWSAVTAIVAAVVTAC